MQDIIEIRDGIYWIGVKDPGLRTFDDLFPTQYGTTYNSYLVKGRDKIAVIDTVKGSRKEEFLAKISQIVDPCRIDAFIVNHTEPDHSGSLEPILQNCPNAVVYSTQAAKTFLSNLIHTPFNSHVVKDGEVLDLGGRSIRFVIAPFLHWPDTMFSLVQEDGVLFSCDAFGAHYCGDSLFSDELPDYTDEMLFYFDCIMRPFKDKALQALDKIRNDRIELVCPSHGPVVRKNAWEYIAQYETWCAPKNTGKKIVIFFLSPHGNTAKMAAAVKKGASLPGIEVEAVHITEIDTNRLRDLMEEASALIFGIPTINRDIPKPMWDVLAYLSTVKLSTNIAGVFGSYGWSGEACRFAEERLKGMGFKLPAPHVRTPFKPKEDILAQCEELGRTVAEQVAEK